MRLLVLRDGIDQHIGNSKISSSQLKDFIDDRRTLRIRYKLENKSLELLKAIFEK